MNQCHVSYDFLELCAKIFRTHPKIWWEKKRPGREGETCILMHDLLDLVDRDKRVDLLGIKIMAWWLYDLKYFDPNATMYLNFDCLSQYMRFGNLWALRKSIGINVYLPLYAFLHSLCTHDVELENMIGEALTNGELESPPPWNFRHSVELQSRVDGLQAVMTHYLGETRAIGFRP